ncbi:MAG: DMT family transporter [Anaerolineae bacterium]|nr:DMT family transporter [Anaerolineae bacterium]
MRRWQAEAALIFITVIWGTTFIVVSDALKSVPPLAFVSLRFLMSSVVLLLMFGRRLKGIGHTEIGIGISLGLVLAVSFVLQTVGLQTTSPGKTAFITGLNVVIVPFLAWWVLRNRPAAGAYIGVLVATVGLALLTLDASLTIAPGDIWVIGCAATYALHIVMIGKYAPHHDTVRLNIVQIITVSLIVGAASLFIERPALSYPASAWGAILYTGVIATALVLSLQAAGQRYVDPTRTALIFSLEPVFAAIFGWLFASEIFGVRDIAGCALILAGMLVAELRFGPPPRAVSGSQQPESPA